jgi:hypothetical protein
MMFDDVAPQTAVRFIDGFVNAFTVSAVQPDPL